MKNRNARVLIISLGMMLIMCVVTALLSFSLADEGTQTSGSGDQAESAIKSTKTNIDYIIENSKDPDADISTFRIVEIGSSSNGSYSPLAKMIENDRATVKTTTGEDGSVTKTIDWTDGDEDNISHFVNMVINGWSTVETEEGSGEMLKMHPDRIVYEYRYAKTTDEDKIQEMKSLIGKADLIYVSNNPDGMYDSSNDIPEDVKLILSAAATATYTPFIIDSPTKTKNGGSDTIPSGITFAHLGAQVLTSAGSSRNAFLYDTSKSTDAVQYLSRTDSTNYKNGMWKPVSGSLVSGNWYKTNEYKREVTGKDANGYPVYKEEDGKPVYVTSETKGANTEVLKNTDGKYVFKDPDGNEVAINAINDDDTAQPQDGIDDVSVLKPVYVETEQKTTSKILTIQASAGDNAITNLFKTAVKTPASYPYDLTKLKAQEGFSTISSNPEAYVINPNEGYSRTYSLDNAFYKAGYAVSKDHPNNVIFDTALASDVLDSSGNIKVDISTYDVIILEAGLKNTGISEDTFRAFNSMVYGMQHIVYAKDLTEASGTNTSNTNTIVKSDAANYTYVMEKVADSNEVARFSNVLVTGKAEMEVYGAAISPNGVKPIADIINNGSYRGVGGGGSSSNLYTVLEIQPCYPIDLELAKVLKALGFTTDGMDGNTDNTDYIYYIKPDSVLNGKTTDEISFDGEMSLADMMCEDDPIYGISLRKAIDNSSKIITKANAVDYYAWDLSKAKIAHLLDESYDKVNVVHMSSTEFNTSRETLLDNYDAIYIGGNYSAFRDYKNLIGTDESNKNIFIQGRTAADATMYEMYFHNGGTYTVTDSAGGGIGILTGNDLTYDKLVELRDYVDAGMPLIFSSEVTEAYYDANQNMYNNTKIDPDSNMFKLLKGYIKGDSYTTDSVGDKYYETSKANVLAGLNPKDQVKIYNGDGSLGTTYGGVVTVFGGIDKEVYIWDDEKGNVYNPIDNPKSTEVNAKELYDLLFNPSTGQRPKFSLIQTPMLYVEGDDSTEIQKGSNITYKYDIASKQNYDINIYIDDNANSRFEEETELLYTSDPSKKSKAKGNVVSVTNDSVTLKLPDSFDGAFYWKFEIVAGKCKSSTTGLSKVKVSSTSKNRVNVLQIVSEDALKITESKGESYTTLLFCTECQEAKGLLRGNRHIDVGKYTIAAAMNNKFGDDNYTPSGGLATIDPSQNDPAYVNVAKNKNLGIHEHNFGIVKYDSNHVIQTVTGIDNWETNWAEDLYDEYDMSIDIWTTSEYEAAVKDALDKVKPEDYDDAVADYTALANLYESYYYTMKEVIDGTVDVGSDPYKQLMSKVTGDSNTVLDRETSTGDFDIDESEWNNYLVAQKNLDVLLNLAKTNVTSVGGCGHDDWMQEIAYELKMHRYYDFYNLTNAASGSDKYPGWYAMNYTAYDANGTNNTGKEITADSNFYNEFSKYFQYWRNAKILEQYFYKMYTKYLMYATMADPNPDDEVVEYLPDFTQVFTCIVIGVSEKFGNDDISNDDRALDAIKAYIDKGGNTFIFHNTIYDEGTPNMTAALKDVFGQNYSHLNVSYSTENLDTFAYEFRQQNSGAITSGNASGTITSLQGLNVKAIYDRNWKLTDIVTSTNNSSRNLVITREQKYPITYSVTTKDGVAATNGSGTLGDEQGITITGTYRLTYANWNYSLQRLSLTVAPNESETDPDIHFNYNIVDSNGNPYPGQFSYYSNEGIKIVLFGSTTFEEHGLTTLANLSSNSGSITITRADLLKNVQSSGSPEALQLYIDGENKLSVANYQFSNNSYSTSLASYINAHSEVVATYTTDGDPNKYFISRLMKSGKSVSNIATNHMTWFTHSTISATPWKTANMYRQTALNVAWYDVSDPQSKQYDSRSSIDIYTDRASQTNKGVVTLYPFLISSELKISGTHPNSYSTDIEDTDMVVYYALSGSGYKVAHSKAAAANPHDGIDQYFLYSYGPVTYCGAGHSSITGAGRDNNDERRLFINVILKSSRKSIFVQDVRIDVFDPTTTSDTSETNLRVVPVEDYYEMQVIGVSELPEFTFKVTVPEEKTDVDEVRIYYDLTPDVDGETPDQETYKNAFGFNTDKEVNGTHYSDVDIFRRKSTQDANLSKGHYKQILDADDNVTLTLQPQYFEPYDNAYTVIMIAVKTTDGKYYFKRIYVKLAPKLWDLT